MSSLFNPFSFLVSRAKHVVALALGTMLVLAATVARAQQNDPLPWSGDAGITETVDQIMARDGMFPPVFPPHGSGKPLRISPDRSGYPQDPAALPLAAYPPLPPGVSAVQNAYSARAPQTIGTSFNGVGLADSGYVPPDTMGDVSTTQILFHTNGRIKVFNKSGVVGALNTTANTFFNTVRNASSVVDPIVRYDRITDRWFVIGINVSTPNRIVLAVSSAGPITGTASFTFFQFQQDLVGATPNADTGTFADYCTLGVDVNALYIGCRMFNTNFYNTTGWVVRKSSMISGGPIVVTAFRGLASGGAGIDGPRGVNNDDSTATQGYFIGADVGIFGRLVLRRISTPGGTPTISANINLTVNTTSNPEPVPAQGSTISLEAIDDRLFAAAIRKNRITGVSTLWTAHAIEVNASGTASSSGGRNGMRWYQIQNFGATPSVLQSGTLFDSAALSPRYYWMGSVNMSGQGHAAIGASFAATDEFIGIATAGRLSGDTLGTVQAPAVIINGVSSYTVDFGSGRNRWGDYSYTAVDPSDDMTMWTIQEYCDATNSWAVRATKLLAPPPATPLSCSPATIAQGSSNVNITLTGSVVAGSGFFDPGAGFPNHIASSIAGTGVTVNSTTWISATQATLNVSVTAGAASTARIITVTNPDGQTRSSAAGILTVTGGCTIPTITTNPIPLIRCTGTSASFTAAGTGSPGPTFQWRRNTTNIAGAISSTFNIASVAAGNAGTYDCVLTNTCGSATTTGALLTVNAAPAITTSPSSISRCPGTSASFTAAGSGSPAPTFQWQRNLVNIAGATSATLSIASVSASDSGSYRCVLTNTCGTATTADASLFVNTTPTITSNPSGASPCIGDSASFSVGATGSTPRSYQWRKNTVNIPSANAPTYAIASVALSDSGAYDCVVTNACGTRTSSAAVLDVQSCCPADFNMDGGIDGADVDAFILAWEAGQAQADVNQDGGIDGADVDVFFFYWEAGGC